MEEANAALDVRQLLWTAMDELDDYTTVWMDTPLAVSCQVLWMCQLMPVITCRGGLFAL